MKTRRSKRLSKSPAKESENSDFENNEKKQKLEQQNTSSKNKKKSIPHTKEVQENGFTNLSLNDNNGNESDSSDSSVDYMKSPHTIDLDSDFFKVDFRKKESSHSQSENKIVSHEQQLTDSEDSSSDSNSKNFQENLPIPPIFTQLALGKTDKPSNINKTEQKSKKRRIKSKLSSSNKSEQTRNKEGTTNVKSENGNLDDLNVSELLALGETQITSDVKKMELSEKSEEEMSDWEEVKGEENKEIKQENISFPKEGVQITVDSPDLYHKRKKKGFDMAAFVKRKMNQVIREQQILIHKVHLLCWVAHGLHVNSVLNSQELMGLSLSLIPSQHCYPNKVDAIYLRDITKWFVKIVRIIEISSEKPSFIPMLESLQQQFESGTAKSHRDLVLMFVCLLRSLGLNARLVISLQPLPLKPDSSELCDIQSKQGRPKQKEKKEEKKLVKKVLSPDEARKLNKKVLSKEEAVKRLKSAETNEKIKDPKAKKPRVEKPIQVKKEDHEKPRRSSRPKKSMTSEYKESSSSSDSEIIENEKTADSCVNKNSSNKVDRKMIERSSSNKSSSNISLMKDKTEGKNSACTSNNREKNKKNNRNVKINVENASSTKDGNVSEISRLKINQDVPHIKTLSSSSGTKNELEKIKRRSIKAVEKTSSLNTSSLEINSVKKSESLNVHDGRIKLTSPVKKHNLGPYSSQTSEDEFLPLSQVRFKKTEERKSTERKKKLKQRSPTSKAESESDFEHELTCKMKQAKARKSLKSDIDRRVLSSESDDESGENDGKYKNNFWVEVFVDSEKWIPVDVINAEVDCAGKLYKRATKPVAYIVAWNPDLTLKDITRRYCTQFHSVTRKQRVDENWWKEALFPFLTPNTIQDMKEDEEMHKQIQNLPLPTSISEYKNHPLYALKRHLLKFQAIYPPDAPTLGFVKGEPVFARECVHTLHSREIWLKEAKVVRLGEEPYKIVKARPKWDRMSGKVITDMPLEIFGPWQVEDYVPPTATDGKVPRNAYGNVELFKPTMLPKGTIHLQVPGLNRVAKKLQIDCAPAVVGFDYHCGACHPMYDGFVVCDEFEDILLDAWNRDQEEAERREDEKRDKRVYGNWRRLIKGLLIRERLKVKYAFGEPEASTSKNKKGKSKLSSKKMKEEEEESE